MDQREGDPMSTTLGLLLLVATMLPVVGWWHATAPNEPPVNWRD